MLTLDQVEYKKNDTIILEHVSLSLQKKEIVTLIGPNGSGKTTLIKIMMGLLVPTSGRRRVSKNIRLGYMPQSIHLDPYLPLTVRHFLSLFGVCDPKIIDTLQLTRLLPSSMQTLSGGEKQRVLLAQAIIKTPHLLILDEPTQGVDIQGQAQFFDLILHLRDQLNCSIFMVSHDLHTVFSKTDHVICLNRHICCQGKPHEVGSFLSNTYGIPSTQSFFAGYQHHHDHSHDIS